MMNPGTTEDYLNSDFVMTTELQQVPHQSAQGTATINIPHGTIDSVNMAATMNAPNVPSTRDSIVGPMHMLKSPPMGIT
jgi:hypothetical protein